MVALVRTMGRAMIFLAGCVIVHDRRGTGVPRNPPGHDWSLRRDLCPVRHLAQNAIHVGTPAGRIVPTGSSCERVAKPLQRGAA